MEQLQDYYQQAYVAVRAVSDMPIVVIRPRVGDLDAWWQDFMAASQYTRVMLGMSRCVHGSALRCGDRLAIVGLRR